MEQESLDYFWSFRSHYCYLSVDRVMALEQTYHVSVNLRPVYPIAIRIPDFFKSIPRTGPNRWLYIVHDTERVAERLGLPFGWPNPDPVTMDMSSMEIARDQPHIFRLTRLGVHACRQNRGLQFAATVSRLIFGGQSGWNQDDRLKNALAEIDLDLTIMDREVAEDPEDYDREITINEQALNDAGHWGVPTLVFRGEPFFGQDRIDDCRWRMEQLGVPST